MNDSQSDSAWSHKPNGRRTSGVAVAGFDARCSLPRFRVRTTGTRPDGFARSHACAGSVAHLRHRRVRSQAAGPGQRRGGAWHTLGGTTKRRSLSTASADAGQVRFLSSTERRLFLRPDLPPVSRRERRRSRMAEGHRAAARSVLEGRRGAVAPPNGRDATATKIMVATQDHRDGH
jgi:hypothetical protein